MSTHFDPEDFIKFANTLHKLKTPFVEALCRTIIGRCYYSAFLISREKLIVEYRHIYLRSIREKVHQEVIDKFNELEPFIGQKLDDLRELRIEADYYCNVILNDKAALRALTIAQRVITRLQTL
jgi:hypothetical protein